MTKNTSKKKSSAAKKLVPAAGMLAISSMMLASSTYAWFTMSREVEVSNIQMSATVPEDIQISLGTIGSDNDTASDGTETLANGLGLLVATDNVVTPPSTNDWDWSNLADISEYYQFGKLIPASSTTGENIFFTPNANGVGKTIAIGAKFYQAAANLTGKTEADLGITGNSRTNPLAATAHVIDSKTTAGYVDDEWSAGGTGEYQTSIGWDNTLDDGYYVDIPVWLRTSSAGGAKLSVQAYVKPANDKQQAGATADEALYRAVRVAIIDVGDLANNTYATSGTTKNLIPINDAWTLSANGTTPGSLTSTDNPFGMTNITGSILDWYGRDVSSGAATSKLTVAADGTVTGNAAVASLGTGTAANTPTYGAAVIYNAVSATAANRVVAELAAPGKTANGVKTDNYGVAHKIVIRVWIEGEDPDCWNETAGQDWSINLKFNNETTNALSGYGGDDLSGVNEGEAPRPVPASP